MQTILGLIVTYNPQPDFFVRLDSFYTQLKKIIMVDNGSKPDIHYLLRREARKRKSSLTIIYNQSNLGIATALNQGFRWALEHGYHYIITFDQDSCPAPGMLPIMLKVLSSHVGDGNLAIVAPMVMDPKAEFEAFYLRPKNRLLFERVSCKEPVLENVTYVITSGSLYDLAAYQKIGPFRDDFFIDYVDTEYCLRAKEKGYKIIVACEAHLSYHQGNRQKRIFWKRDHFPTFHSPLRWYFSSRNRILMLRRYAIHFPHWLLYEMVASFYILIKMLLFETQKVEKLKAIFYGTLDGILGRMGKATDDVVKGLGL